MTVHVFPAAAAVAVRHPADCACRPCTDALVADLRRPLVPPGPRTDPALTKRERS